MRFRVCSLLSSFGNELLDKMETGWGHLVGPMEHSEGRGGESVVAILRFLCGSPCLCRLRTEGLIPVSKYWMYRSHAGDMDPVSWCSCVTTWSKPLPLLQGYREGGGMRWPKTMARPVCLRSPRLLPGVGACFILVGTSERLPTWITWDVGSGTLCKSSMESMWRVDRVFPDRMYINSNHRDSWIWVAACSWLPSSSNLLD
jgi:hypothetical protein